MKAPSTLKLRTSPSNIAKIMESGCQRSLFFHAVSEQKDTNKNFLKKYYQLDVDKLQQNEQVKNKFRRDAGNELEMDILLDRNIPSRLNITTYGVKGHYYPPVMSNSEKLNEKDTLALLKELTHFDAFQKKNHLSGLKYLYQVTLKATDGFRQKYHFDDADQMFDFNVSYPDLILITPKSDGLLLSLIDIKMAEHIRLKQKIQVTLYALLLHEIVHEQGLDKELHVDLSVGYIWHRGKAEPTPFDMEEVLPHVEQYLREDVPMLANTIRSFCEQENADLRELPLQLSHRLCSQCEYCDYMPYCLKLGRKVNDFQRIPYLSAYGQRCLEELALYGNGEEPREQISMTKTARGATTCEDISLLLKKRMQDPITADSIRQNPSLREYIKETDDGMIIDRYTKLLSMTAGFDHRQAEILSYKAQEGFIKPQELLEFLSSLTRQKELDRTLIRDRMAKLQQSISAACPENSRKTGSLQYLYNYQQSKLEELESILSLSRSIRAGLEEKHPTGSSSSMEQQRLPDDILAELKELSHKNLAPKQFEIRKRTLIDFPLSTYDTLSLFLTAQKDEISGRMFALAYAYFLPKGNDASRILPSDNTCILIADTEEDMDRIEREFIDRLHSLFMAVHEYNRPFLESGGTENIGNTAPRLRLQCFVMDHYESDNLTEFLYDALERSESTVSEKIMDILSWLQDERLAEQEQTRSDIICDHPFVSLSGTVRRLFILPAEIAYSFDDIAGMFVISAPFRKNTSYYSNYFSNSISAGFIRSHWQNPAEEKFSVNKLKTELSMRLIQESMIRQGILNELNTETVITGKKLLISYAPVFCLPGHSRYRHTLLSKLHFQCRYEEMLSRLRYRALRTRDIEDLMADHIVTHVKYLGCKTQPAADGDGNRLDCYSFEILNYHDGLTIPDMGFTLMDADPDALQEFAEKSNFVNSENENIWGLMPEAVSVADEILSVYLAPEDKLPLKPQNLYYIFERYVNWTTPYITGGRFQAGRRQLRGVLKDIDLGCHEENIAALLTDPCGFAEAYTAVHQEDLLTAEDSLVYENRYFRYPFAPSQQDAFLQFYNRNLSLVQGPPGTGKTNFIAMSILIYLLRREEQGEDALRIFITSNSHVAIENVLKKVAELLEDVRRVSPDFILKIYKVEKSKTSIDTAENQTENNPAGIMRLAPDHIGQIFCNAVHVIAGATVWALEKPFQNEDLDPQEDLFDVVIVDEASQMRLIDAAIALAHVKKGGKILLVGDHEQLPPIIQGNYLPAEDKPFTAGSVFQYFIEHDSRLKEERGGLLYSKRLNEQFRMNEILSLYPSVKIYENEYIPANRSVAEQKLTLLPCPENTGMSSAKNDISEEAFLPSLCEWMMDPAYPFVLCDIRSGSRTGFLAADAKKEFEVKLVRALTEYCIYHLADTDGNLYTDAETFWHEGMFIISPHHEHINRLRAAVKDLRRNDLPQEQAAFGIHAFIDTVDKMQGQEAEVALVSYGISDAEQAVREKEFVFNRNRLNVSITRGKKKMILILTDALTEKQLELMAEEDQKLINGIAFMNAIKTFASSNDTENGIATLSQSQKMTVQDGGISVEIHRKKSLY